MNDNVESIILEHLRSIRATVDHIDSDVSELKSRLFSLETGIARITTEQSSNYGEIIQDRHVVDRLKERIARIEKRLELSDS